MPVQALNQNQRDAIYQRTLAAVKREVARTGSNPEGPLSLIGHCLEFAWQGYLTIKAWPGAPRTIIQAGSAQWPRIPAALDDGKSPTHFAYQWDSNSDVVQLLQAGIMPLIRRPDGQVAASLPEMHVWLACPESGELIDFSTGLWPAACKALIGLDWLAAEPPAYLWTFGCRCPEGVHYRPERDAIATIIRLLHQQGKQYP